MKILEHNDHFDPAALRATMGDSRTVVCLSRKAPTVASRGLRTYGLETYEPYLADPWTLVLVPAEDGTGEEQVSWVIIGGGHHVEAPGAEQSFVARVRAHGLDPLVLSEGAALTLPAEPGG